MNKLLRKIVPMILIATILVSCDGIIIPESTGSTRTTEDKQLVGVILPTKDEPRWLQDEARFKEVLESKGYNVKISFSEGSSDIEKQNVEALISEGADVIVICAQDGGAAAPAVEEAKEAGIKIIAYDRLITGTDAVDYYVTFDSVAVGGAQAKYLVAKAGYGSNLPLYLYAGAQTDNNAFLFFEGAWEVLQPKIADGTFVIANSKEAQNLANKEELTREEQEKIITEITTNWDSYEAAKKAKAHLRTVPTELKGHVFILAPNDSGARSIADVFATDPEIKSYYITGQDAERPSVQYIIDGKQSMTVFKDVRILANDAIDMAVVLLSGQTPATTATYNNGEIDIPSMQTGVKIVDADNVKFELISSEYYSESDFTNLK